MARNPNNKSISERLGLPTGQNIPLVLGQSFSERAPTNQSYHTLRYDFKPASIDLTQNSKIEIDDKSTVTVTAPNAENSTSDDTVFKGNKKPYAKECVLIIDHETGQVTLEKLVENMTVKTTRKEGSSKAPAYGLAAAAAAQRPVTPSLPSSSQKTSKATSSGQSSKSSKKDKKNMHDTESIKIDKSQPSPDPTPAIQSSKAAKSNNGKTKRNPAKKVKIEKVKERAPEPEPEQEMEYNQDEELTNAAAELEDMMASSYGSDESNDKSLSPPSSNTSRSNPLPPIQQLAPSMPKLFSSSNSSNLMTSDLQLSESGSDSD